jgi:hypothetical protein
MPRLDRQSWSGTLRPLRIGNSKLSRLRIVVSLLLSARVSLTVWIWQSGTRAQACGASLLQG